MNIFIDTNVVLENSKLFLRSLRFDLVFLCHDSAIIKQA